MTYLWFRGSRVRPEVVEALLVLRRAYRELVRFYASRGACWPAVECLVRSHLPERGEVGAWGDQSVHRTQPLLARRLRGRATVTSSRKNTRTEGKRATQNEKTPPIL